MNIGLGYYCKKKRLPFLKRILNRIMFWKPRIDSIITDIEINHIAKIDKNTNESET